MKMVQTDDLPVQERKSSGRVGTLRTRTVFTGEPGSIDNFSFRIYDQDGSFASPRHHHNFDQFRYQIDGEADFARNGLMTPGVLGYFPEGAYYGPQSGPPHTVAVLQFAGPSGSGYLSSGEHHQATEELRELGTFDNGIFRRHPDVEGKRTQDSYEAVWEHVTGRPLVYPEPQYTDPIMMHTDRYPWQPVDGATDVQRRTLGTFTSCHIRAVGYRLAPGAQLSLDGRSINLVLSGSGAVDDTPFRAMAAVYLDQDEQGRFTADDVTEIILMGMPITALMTGPRA